MRTREKLLFAVVIATLILGGVIVFSLRGSEVDANYTRWMLANNIRQFVSSPGAFLFGSAETGQSMSAGGYAVIAGIGLLVMVVLLRAFRDSQIHDLKRHVQALDAAKSEAEQALQEEVWKGRTARQAKDSVTRDLEDSIERMESMILELTAKEHALKARDDELRALKTSAPVARPIIIGAGGGDQALRAELVQTAEALQAKDGEVRELRQLLQGKARLWESQLQGKDDILRRREAELEIAQSESREFAIQVKELESAHRRAEEQVEKEIENKKQLLEASASAGRNLEQRLQETIHELEQQAGGRDKLIKSHEGEIAALRQQLSEAADGHAQSEARLRSAREEIDGERKERERALTDLEFRLRSHIRGLQGQIEERDMLVQVRDDEINALKSEVHVLGARAAEANAARQQAQSALDAALRNRQSMADDKSSAIRDLEERYGKSLRQLELEMREKDGFLAARDEEIRALTERARSLKQAQDEGVAAGARAQASLDDELRRERELRKTRESDHKELESRVAGELNLRQQQVSERDALLQNRDAEIATLQAQLASLSEQLNKVGSAKERAANLLQEKLRKEKAFLSASDSALRELEANFSAKTTALEQQLADRQKLVGSRDAELSDLRAELIATQQQASEWAAAKQQIEKQLESAVEEKAALRQSQDRAAKQKQSELAAQQLALESALSEKETRLKDRELELSEVKRQLAELDTATDQTARLFQADAKEKDELLRQREAALQETEKRAAERQRDFEAQLAERQSLLDGRGGEVETLRVKIKELTGEIDRLANTKEQSDRELDLELRQRDDSLRAKESQLKQLDSQLKGQVTALEARLAEQQNLVATREGEVDALMNKVREISERYSVLASEKERGDRAFQEELRDKASLLQAREATAGEIEERFTSKMEVLGHQLAEKHKLLESGSVELTEMRAQIASLREKLHETEVAKVHLERLVEEARARAPQLPAVIASEDEGAEGDSSGLDALLNERAELLKSRDQLIQNLMTELKEKKTQLARHEIQVWQGIERRDLWKHRLSKVGIRLKD